MQLVEVIFRNSDSESGIDEETWDWGMNWWRSSNHFDCKFLRQIIHQSEVSPSIILISDWENDSSFRIRSRNFIKKFLRTWEKTLFTPLDHRSPFLSKFLSNEGTDDNYQSAVEVDKFNLEGDKDTTLILSNYLLHLYLNEMFSIFLFEEIFIWFMRLVDLKYSWIITVLYFSFLDVLNDFSVL